MARLHFPAAGHIPALPSVSKGTWKDSVGNGTAVSCCLPPGLLGLLTSHAALWERISFLLHRGKGEIQKCGNAGGEEKRNKVCVGLSFGIFLCIFECILEAVGRGGRVFFLYK